MPMPKCTAAWNIYRKWKSRDEKGDELSTITRDMAVSALAHIGSCYLCGIKRKNLTQPLSAPPFDPWNSLLPYFAKALGVDPKNISRDTPLGPIQVANIIIVLSRVKRVRVNCFHDRITLGELIIKWAMSQKIE